MSKVNISTLLNFLPVVGPVMAALPEFKALFDELKSTFNGSDQATLEAAYARALAGAEAQHEATQAAAKGK